MRNGTFPLGDPDVEKPMRAYLHERPARHPYRNHLTMYSPHYSAVASAAERFLTIGHIVSLLACADAVPRARLDTYRACCDALSHVIE